MLKTLLAQVREFKKASFLTPFFMILEVLFETLIPLAMASIIDKGVEAGNIGHIYRMGGVMVVLALCGLWSGVMGGKYGALASTGFARNLRKPCTPTSRPFLFPTSTNTALPADHPSYHRCDQPAECLSDDPAYVYPCTGQPDLCHGHGISHQRQTCKHLSDRGDLPRCLSDLYHAESNEIFPDCVPQIR